MFGIARRRRQAGSCSLRSARPEATSRAARTSAIERFGARPQASSSAGERPASQAAEGGARSVPHALLRPWRRTMRRWMAAARPDSISCSQIAQASASNGSGRRRGRSHGLRRITGPISGSRRKRRWNARQVVVGAEREAHALDAGGRGLARRASARMRTACRRPRRAARPARRRAQSTRRARPRARTHHPVAARCPEARYGPERDDVAARPRLAIGPSGGGCRRGRSAMRRRRASCRERARAAAGAAPARGRRRTRTSTKVATPSRKPPVAAATAAGSETSAAALDRPRLGEHRQGPDLASACSGSGRAAVWHRRVYRTRARRPYAQSGPLVDAVLLDDLAAHRLHAPVHRLVGLEDPAHLAPLDARASRPCRSARRRAPAATPVCW